MVRWELYPVARLTCVSWYTCKVNRQSPPEEHVHRWKAEPLDRKGHTAARGLCPCPPKHPAVTSQWQHSLPDLSWSSHRCPSPLPTRSYLACLCPRTVSGLLYLGPLPWTPAPGFPPPSRPHSDLSPNVPNLSELQTDHDS